MKANNSNSREKFALMEVDDSNRFDELAAVADFYASAPPVRTKGDDWFVWQGSCWNPISKDRLRPIAMEVLSESHKKVRNAKAIIDHVQTAKQLGDGERFHGGAIFGDDDDSVLINVNNGVVRVRGDSVELLPHSPEYNFLGVMAANWDETAQPHLFCKYLPQWLPDHEDRILLQWFGGYLLYPNCARHEVFLLCYGEGGSGKSTMVEAIQAAFGSEILVQGLSMNQLCSSGQGAYSLPSLEYAMVNVGTELDTVEMDESSNFKKIVSGEPLQVRGIYGHPFTMRTNVKLLFCSNSLPRFKHGTSGELRRARFLGFNLKVPADQKDSNLKDRMKAEKDGMLTWLVEGLQMILRGVPCPNGSFDSQRVTDKFAISNDPVGYFVKHRCVIDPKAMTPKDEFHKEFMEYLDSQGFPLRSKEYLYRSLYERVPELGTVRVKIGDKWHRGKVDGVCHLVGYHVTGIRTKNDEEE